MKTLLAILLTAVTLVGCNNEKSDLQLQLDHKLAMEREKTRQIAAENQVSDTYNIEHEYEYNTQEPRSSDIYDESHEMTQSHDSIVQSPSSTLDNTQPVQPVADTGFSGTTVAGAAIAGAAVGYLASNNKEVIKDKTVAVVDKTKAKVNQIKESPKTKSIVNKAKYQTRKAKVLSKKAYKKAKRKINKSTRK